MSAVSEKRPCASVLPAEMPALLATFADYFGLATMTPTLPFYLGELGIGAATVASWTGAILSAQFGAVVVGNLVWGNVADRLGARRALQLTMLGDVVFFSATAFARSAPELLLVRLLAGASTPLVPALSFIFEVKL